MNDDNKVTTSRLRDFPILFDTDELFRPEKWEESYETIETKNQTEAGTDSISVTRFGKLSVSCEFACTAEWKKTFLEYSRKLSFTLSFYDVENSTYVQKTVRMRNFKSTTEIHSDYVTESVGLYTVTFDLIEF